jgi:hypothetical protein
MRIDARISEVYAGQQARLQASNRSATSFSAAMDAAKANYSEKVDFTNMTRQELEDSINSLYFSGKISFDELRTLVWTTAAGGIDVPDDTRYNFIQIAREGIEGALWRKDETKLKLLETGLRIMQKVMSETE